MFFIFALLASTAFAAIAPRPVPRTASKIFVESGVFEGGTPIAAHIQGLRFSRNAKTGVERWVLDFSDAKTKNYQLMAPEFQVKLLPSEKVKVADGKEVLLTPPRIIVYLDSIKTSQLDEYRLQKLIKRSKLVRTIRVYPPIEDGDRAIEFVLKKEALLEPHQPLQKEGRLVLDLKPRQD